MSSEPPHRSPLPRLSSHRTVWNALVATLSLAAYRAFNGGVPVLIGLFIAHQWGLTVLAAFALANAFLAVAIVIGDWGSSRLLPRELARGREAGGAVLATSSAIRLLLVVAMIGFTAALAVTGRLERDVTPFMLLLAPVAIASVAAVNAVSLRVVEADMRGVPTAVLFGAIPVVAAAVFADALPGGPHGLVAVYSAAKLLETAILTGRRPELLRLSLRRTRATFVTLLPFGASAVIATLYARLPIFVASEWTTREELGIISASTALQNVLLLVPVAMAAMTYPRVAVAVARSDVTAVAVELKRYTLTAGPAIGAGLLILWAAIEQVCSALDIPSRASSFVLAYAALAVFTTTSTIAGATLQALGHERRVAAVGLLYLVVATPLQIVATSEWGMWGTLATLTLADGSAAIVLAAYAWRRSAALRRAGERLQTAWPM